jgi:hypothetical protein
MTEDRSVTDAAEAVAFCEAASVLVTLGLKGQGVIDDDALRQALRKGIGKLFLHVQVTPMFAVLLCYDAAPDDRDQEPLELARWTGEAAAAILSRAALH